MTRGTRARRWPLPAWATLGFRLALGTHALATPSAKLVYSRGPGAETCPDESALRKAVAERLGYDPFFPWADKTIEAEIVQGKRGFRGEVKVIDARGLVRALALAISIALDDLDIDATPPPETNAPGTSDAPVPLEAPSSPAPSAPARGSGHGGASPAKPAPFHPSTTPLSPAVWLSPVLSFGAAPAPAFGLHVDFQLRYGIAAVDLEAQLDLPASGGDSSQGKVQTYLVLGSVAPCVRFLAPFFACALLSLGSFQETGEGLAVSNSQSAWFAAAGGRLGIEVPLVGRVFLIAHGDAVGVFTRPNVQIDGMTAFTLPALMGRVGLGGGIRF